MQKKALWFVFALVFVLVNAPAAPVRPAGVVKAEIWKNESFVKKAQLVKEGNWDKISTRDVAIVQLFEIGRAAERIERRLRAEANRFYTLAFRGGLLLGVYLILQLAMTLILIIRLGRRAGQRNYRGPGPLREDYQA